MWVAKRGACCVNQKRVTRVIFFYVLHEDVTSVRRFHASVLTKGKDRISGFASL